tara:strand:- start:154 stop:843 length:690 start_codon:yes stop_codon:yes gene_type:complete
MPATYLDLSNRVLRRLNEVEMTSSDFPTTRGVQALVKDAVKASIASINQSEFEWPFNAAEHTETLVIGKEEYDWPQYFKVVDWNSFQLITVVNGSNVFEKLDYISRDEYYENYRDADNNADSAGIEKPNYVYPSHGNGFGVTPSPDAAYKVRFRYFLNYATLTLYDDQTRVPESFSSVIVDGALMHMYMFKDNVEAAQVSRLLFMEGLKNLQTLYINNFEQITDHRVNY